MQSLHLQTSFIYGNGNANENIFHAPPTVDRRRIT